MATSSSSSTAAASGGGTDAVEHKDDLSKVGTAFINKTKREMVTVINFVGIVRDMLKASNNDAEEVKKNSTIRHLVQALKEMHSRLMRLIAEVEHEELLDLVVQVNEHVGCAVHWHHAIVNGKPFDPPDLAVPQGIYQQSSSDGAEAKDDNEDGDSEVKQQDDILNLNDDDDVLPPPEALKIKPPPQQQQRGNSNNNDDDDDDDDDDDFAALAVRRRGNSDKPKGDGEGSNNKADGEDDDDDDDDGDMDDFAQLAARNSPVLKPKPARADSEADIDAISLDVNNNSNNNKGDQLSQDLDALLGNENGGSGGNVAVSNQELDDLLNLADAQPADDDNLDGAELNDLLNNLNRTSSQQAPEDDDSNDPDILADL